MVYSMRISYLGISSILLLAEGIFLPLFWFVHEPPTAPGFLGVYSLFGIDHPPHFPVLVILSVMIISSFIILRYYRHGRKWAWYLLLIAYLGLIVPVTIGAAISPGIGADGYFGRWYYEVSLLGVIIPWILFIPGILLGSGMVLGSRPKSHGPPS